MDEGKWLAERFEEQRPRLRAVAYRMLGSLSEAEDAVQEAWLRLNGSAHGELDDLGAWLTTVVARISLNMLRSRKQRSEAHVPEPIIDPITIMVASSGPSPRTNFSLGASILQAEGATTATPAAARLSRSCRANSTALGVSPCTHIVSATIAMSLPSIARTTCSRSMRRTRELASAASWRSASERVRGTSEPSGR